MENKEQLRIRDSGGKPEIYGSELVGMFFDGTALTIQIGRKAFEAARTNEAPGPADKPVVITTGAVILSPAAAVDIANAINRVISAAVHLADKPAGEAPN